MTEAIVVTLGCRLNTFESRVIRREAEAAGANDAVIVNTCAVTGEAVRQARQTIRRLKRDHPDRPIIVTGCAAQLSPESFAAMPEVSRVLGNREKLDRSSWSATSTPVMVGDILTVRETAYHLIDGFEGRARAFLEIQQGCDHRCTFCIIPFARGPHRSLPADQIIAQCRRLVDNGFREIVLTGVDICSYGRDLGNGISLGWLVNSLLTAIPDLPRLRLSTLDPAAIDDLLFEALARHERLMPHWHLSVQAADDLILKRMRRRHLRQDLVDVVERARRQRPDIVFGADLIAGFPTETDDMFENTVESVRDLGVVYLHVFPYSPRPGTPAARMPQVPAATRRERAAHLREAGQRAKERYFASRIGTITDVLIETTTTARCPYYAPITLASAGTPGALANVRLDRTDGESLIGEPLT